MDHDGSAETPYFCKVKQVKNGNPKKNKKNQLVMAVTLKYWLPLPSLPPT